MWLLLSCPNLHVCWLFPSRLLPGRQLMSFGLKRDLVTHYICLMLRKASEGLLLLCSNAATWGMAQVG